MTNLSVNINKFATLRNARGGNLPDVLKAAQDCERFGADGITVHPRPDERHIRRQDVLDLKPLIKTEFNIEGNPVESFLQLVRSVKPTQCTLVPDAVNDVTSNQGWNTVVNRSFLSEVVTILHDEGIRVSIFVDPDVKMIEGAKELNADRIELYTGPYAEQFLRDEKAAIADYVIAAEAASDLGLEINAGHDLNLQNLNFFARNIPQLSEVSIGHSLICDALYLGLENTIQLYKRALQTY